MNHNPMIPRVGMRVDERYRLVRSRGKGGIGEVWEAVQAPTERRVALKMLLPVWLADPDVRKRFVREGRLASTMNHRHIVDVLEVGETREGMPFIAMELLEGLPLHRVVEYDGVLPWERVKRIVRQLCGALDHAHAMKIVHRDVKPSNVMLVSPPGQPDECKLVDFGIAKQVLVNVQTAPLTAEGQMLGSPGFTSPEQLQGRPTDPRADIYGLGCTAYYLLTGQIPYRGGSATEMLHNALYDSPQPLELDLDEELRADIEAVLHRAVHREPRARFDTILDFVVALNQIGRGQGRGPRAQTSTSMRAVFSESPGPQSSASPDSRPGSQPDSPLSPPPGPLQDTIVEGHRPLASGTPHAVAETPLVSPFSGPRGVISTKSYSPVLAGKGGIDRVSWGAPEGFVELARMPPDVIVVHMSGLIGTSASWLFEPQLGLLLERHRPAQLFWHLDFVQSYPPEVRDATLRCLEQHREHVGSIHVLKGAGRAGLAVSLAMVALGNRTRQYDDAGVWRETLEQWARGERE